MSGDGNIRKSVFRRVWFWVLVVIFLGMGGCITLVGVAGTAINNANNKTHTVVYTITGSGTADVTYATASSNSGSGESQDTGATLPWTKTITAKGLFSAYSVDAQTQGSSSVSCSITVDGKSVSTNSSSGQYATVDCSGTNPS